MTGFIVPSNLKYAPYVQYYIDLYKKENAEFEIISWDRRGEREDVHYAYHRRVSDNKRVGVMLGYVGFSSFVRRIIKKRKYDSLVVFTVAAAVFLSRTLKKYKNKYIFDIRDSSPLTARAPKKFKAAVIGAREVVSSSPSFGEWIGREAHICHNVDVNALVEARSLSPRAGDPSLHRIVFAGFLNEHAINSVLVKTVAGDNRFELSYYGPSSEGRAAIERYVAECGAKNISFFGTYQKSQIISIYRENADFANVIRTKSRVNRDALPNKLYDAIGAGVPIIVFEHNEAIADYAKMYNLGLILRDGAEEDFASAIVSAIAEFDYEAFAAGRQEFIGRVVSEQEKFIEAVKNFIRNGETKE